jgi:hypothetical protein
MRDQLPYLAFLLLLFSCADTRPYSDVLGSKKVSDLTKTEAIRLCEEAKDDPAELDVGLCTLFAMDSDYEKEDCESNISECLKSFDRDRYDCEDIPIENLADCNATVGEAEDCFSQWSSFVKSLNCSHFGNVPDSPECSNEMESECLNWLLLY